MIVAQWVYDKRHATKSKIKVNEYLHDLAIMNAIVIAADRLNILEPEDMQTTNALYKKYIRYGKKTGSMREVKLHVIRMVDEIPEIEFSEENDAEKQVI